MFKSFINPKKIIGNGTKAVNPKAFLNFLTGVKSTASTDISASSVDGTSNIQKNTQVRPAKLNLQSLLSTISENISNIYNSNITQNVQVRAKEDSKSSNILKGFLNVLKNSIDFINFFGNTRSGKRIENGVKALRNMFNDSFNTATTIRQTINKIVKQLSNLPTIAVPSSSETKTESKVENGTVTQTKTPPPTKGGKANLVKAAGVAGIGAAGMQAAKLSQEEKLAETTKRGVGSEGKPDGFMEGLNKIIEKFSESINNLLGKSKKSSGSSGGGGGASGSGGGGGGPGGGPGGGGGKGKPTPDVSSSPGDLKLAGFLSTLESTGNQNQADVVQSILNRTSQNYGKYGGLISQLTKSEAYSPLSAAIYGASRDEDASGLYSKITAKLGKTPSERIKKLQEISSQPNGLELLQKLFGKGSAADAAIIINDFQNNGPLSKAAATFVKGRTDFGASSGRGGAQGVGQITRGGTGANVFGAVGSEKPAALLNKIEVSKAKPATNVKSKQKPASTIKPAPQKPKAIEVSKNIAAPQGQDSGKKVEVALAPTVNVMQGGGGGSQNAGERVASAPPITGPGGGQNVAPFGRETKNMFSPGNVYASFYTPFGVA